MPTYNCEKFVTTAIKSVLAQSYKDFELIAVDDGSSDNTYNLVNEIAITDNRVRPYRLSHGGVSRARNFGIEKAKGDSILFIDCDDSWDETLLEECFGVSNFDLTLFGIRSDFYNEDDTFSHSRISLSRFSQPEHITWTNRIDTIVAKYNMASPCNKVYKKSIIEKNNIRFCENCVYLEDFKFNLDYMQYIKEMYVINKDLYKYRLYLGTKPILKRQFKGLFLNTDELVVSAKRLLEGLGSGYSNHPVLVSTLLGVYFQEFYSRTYGKDKLFSKNILKTLNKNKNYRELLSHTKGKFFVFFKILVFFRCYALQIKTIGRRYIKCL